MEETKKILDFDKIEKYVEEEKVRTNWTGEKKVISELLNINVAIVDFELFPSKFGNNFASIQGMLKGNKLVWFNTGSQVMIDQLNKLGKENLPKVFVIQKVKNYYTLRSGEM